MNLLTKIIGRLMFLANNEGKRDQWYSLKDKLIKKFGVNNGYDLQFIPGKKCNSCSGTGKFTKYSFGSAYKEPCWRCTAGWYKLPLYVLLERNKVGDQVFHKPIERAHTTKHLAKYNIPLTVTINGYIEYKKQKYGWMAYSLLYILFDPKGYWKIVKSMGQGWRCAWWLPKNYLNNMVHLIRKKHRAIPVTSAQRKFKQLFKRPRLLYPVSKDDLPF